MPFLRLNGWSIPLDPESTNRMLDEVARVTRQASGMLTADRVNYRRHWELKTVHLPYADLMGLYDWVSGTPIGWHLDNDLTSNLASTLQTGTASTAPNFRSATAADGTPSPSDAKFGSYALGPATTCTNLWSSNIASGTDTSSATTGFTAIASAVLASSTARYWQGARSLGVTTTGAGDGFQTATFVGSAGSTYAAGLYLTGTAGTVLQATLKQNSTVLTQVSLVLTAGWQRLPLPMLTGTLPSSSDVHLEVVQLSAGVATWYADGLQLEQSRYTTPWVNGSRSSPSYVSVDAVQGVLGSARGITLNAWCTAPESPLGGIILKVADLVSAVVTPTAITLGTYLGPSALRVTCINATGTWVLTTPSTITWPTGGWRMVTATVVPGGINGPEMAVYLDGALIASSSPGLGVNGFDCSLLSRVYFGHDNGAFLMDGGLDEVAVFPFAAGSSLPASLFAYGAALPTAWPNLIADGDFIGGDSLTVQAQVESVEFEPFVTSAGFQTAGGTATLKVMVV